MKAYKAFKKDLTCQSFQYEEGQEYKMDDKPILCERGFHFCKDLVLTLQYYTCNKITDNKYAEVEVLGDTEFEQPTHHKGVTNHIKIVRVLLDSEVISMVDSHQNSGNRNSGDWNSGNRNSGEQNSGNWNSGDWNSGNLNSGNRNSGNRNSGNRNSGNRNSGNRNSGNWNSGNLNSGKRNSGNWNACNHETGFFNTKSPETINVFNQPCKIEDWTNAEKPSFIYFDIDPKLGYKGSWQKAFESATKEDIKLLKALPNFDKDVFFELTGIKL